MVLSCLCLSLLQSGSSRTVAVKEDSCLIFWMDQTNTALHNQATQLLRCSLFFCVVGKARCVVLGNTSMPKGTWAADIISQQLPFHCPGSPCYVTPAFQGV